MQVLNVISASKHFEVDALKKVGFCFQLRKEKDDQKTIWCYILYNV